MTVTQQGYTAVTGRDGSEYRLMMSDHTAILKAWKERILFFDGTDHYGGPRSIRLDTIESIALWTPDRLAVMAEDLKAERLGDTLGS